MTRVRDLGRRSVHAAVSAGPARLGRGRRHRFPVYRLFVIVVAAGVGVLLWVLNEKTLIGAKLRAAVDDPEMAAGMGINVALLSGLVFAAGAGLAAFGGVMGGPILGGYPGIDFDLLPLAFVVVIIGGMGSLQGRAGRQHRRRPASTTSARRSFPSCRISRCSRRW